MKNMIWTKSEARLNRVKISSNKKYNWLFIPGGPGLGSEYLFDLIQLLALPGTMWLFDFPNDGSNLTKTPFSHWQKALIEASTAFDDVIIVAHSSGGMFTLATPEIENNIIGLVLMDSAPDSTWQPCFAEHVKQFPIDEANRLQHIYNESPSNEILKKLTMACAPYFSTKHGLQKTISLFETLPFNYMSHQWAEKNFDSTYQAKWIPQHIPTLIFAGDQDYLTPLKWFRLHPAFKRENILMREVHQSAHFPWIDNPLEVKQIFNMLNI